MKHDHRLFTIGCSFTKYHWNTWADYCGSKYKEHINLARTGAGNQFIAKTITEAFIDYDITPNDRIVIQWSSCQREDRYLSEVDHNGRYNYWRVVGNIFKQSYYDDDWVEKYTTLEHFVKRDFMLIHNTYYMLKYHNIPFVMTSMVDLYPPYHEKEIMQLSMKYVDILQEIKPSMKKVIFNNVWPDKKTREDQHPTPEEHIMYSEKQLQGVINNEWQ